MLLIYKMPSGRPKESLTLEERFFSRVDKAGPSVSAELGPCWLWTGASQHQGYGLLLRHIWGEILAHRWIYKHTHGELSPDLMVRHKCDVKTCVNPDHLETGTAKDNVTDMIERHPHACGRKLSDTQIAEIIELRAAGVIYSEIAEKFDVNRRTIERICLGQMTYAPISVLPDKTRREALTENVIRLYKEGWANCHITKLLSCSSSSICEILKEHPELNRTLWPIISTKQTLEAHMADTIEHA